MKRQLKSYLDCGLKASSATIGSLIKIWATTATVNLASLVAYKFVGKVC